MKKFFVALTLTATIFLNNGSPVSAREYDFVESINLRNVRYEVAYRNENFAWEVLQLVNKERAKVGVAPLRLADDLQAATAIRAREIVYDFSHTRPDSSSCFTVMRNKGRACGENIAAGHDSAYETVEQWMNSAGHRKNILNPAFRELGVGYFYAEDSTYRHYWVQLFRG